MGGASNTTEVDGDNDNDDDDETTGSTRSKDSADEALCEMLGLSSLDAMVVDDDESDGDGNNHHPRKCRSLEDLMHRINGDSCMEDIIVNKYSNLRHEYETTGVCVLPPQLSVPASIMRKLTEEVVWGGDRCHPPVNRTYETIQFVKKGSQQQLQGKRVLTRLENLNGHDGWHRLCNIYIRKCLSCLLGEEMVLYKTKLNLKPPGGSGFAPHLDTPSLRIAFFSGENDNDGPQTFVTVMIAIDDMTIQNGCLRVVRGPWKEHNALPTIQPESDGNPDAGGRAGAIIDDDGLDFDDLCCSGGTIVVFNGWVPHRSSANRSCFARRAVFLTYNPASEGDFHDRYYDRMAKLRNDWRKKVGLKSSSPQEKEQILSADEQQELDALATIPRI